MSEVCNNIKYDVDRFTYHATRYFFLLKNIGYFFSSEKYWHRSTSAKLFNLLMLMICSLFQSFIIQSLLTSSTPSVDLTPASQ